MRAAPILALLFASTGAGTGTAGAGCDSAEAAPVVAERLRLSINVPAYRLEVIENGVVTRTIPVAVGQPRYRTPLGRYAIDYVIWNPWWYPPDEPWARKEHITPPGWANPVGRVKLHVTGLVFLHGTPLVPTLGSAASHACVRMKNEDATFLARLVHQYGSPAVRSATLDSLEADTGATRRIAMPAPVPLEIRYELAEVRGDDLAVYPDIYGYAGGRVPTAMTSAVAAILRHRGDTAGLELSALRGVVRRARRRGVLVPLDSLFLSGAGGERPPAPAVTPRVTRGGARGWW